MTDLTFHHLGVAVPDLDDAITTYESIFGYLLTAGPFADPVQQACVCFLQPQHNGEPLIEAIAPLGEGSRVQRLIDKGAGAYHAGYETDDLDDTIADVRAKGCLLIGEPTPAVAFDGRRIAWFYTPARQLVEVVER